MSLRQPLVLGSVALVISFGLCGCESATRPGPIDPPSLPPWAAEFSRSVRVNVPVDTLGGVAVRSTSIGQWVVASGQGVFRGQAGSSGATQLAPSGVVAGEDVSVDLVTNGPWLAGSSRGVAWGNRDGSRSAQVVSAFDAPRAGSRIAIIDGFFWLATTRAGLVLGFQDEVYASLLDSLAVDPETASIATTIDGLWVVASSRGAWVGNFDTPVAQILTADDLGFGRTVVALNDALDYVVASSRGVYFGNPTQLSFPMLSGSVRADRTLSVAIHWGGQWIVGSSAGVYRGLDNGFWPTPAISGGRIGAGPVRVSIADDISSAQTQWIVATPEQAWMGAQEEAISTPLVSWRNRLGSAVDAWVGDSGFWIIASGAGVWTRR